MIFVDMEINKVTIKAFEETLKGAVLGKAINLQISDPDRDLTDGPDKIVAVVEAEISQAGKGAKRQSLARGEPRIGHLVDRAVENIGARRLYTVIERVFEELSFTAPDRSGDKVGVDAAFVEKHLGDLARSTDLSRYVL